MPAPVPTEEGGEEGAEGEPMESVTWENFERFATTVWARHCEDVDALAFELLAAVGRDYIVPEDLEIITADVLDNHPAFEFLIGSPAFQARFSETVISRLFYLNPRSGRKRMYLREFRGTGLLKLLQEVEVATNSLGASMPSVFSYKDFYVIYCKFWELDRDRDMRVTLSDLEFYGKRALSRAALSRVIECHGCLNPDGTRPPAGTGFLGYREFVAFILSVEDKTTDSALDYWFRVLDLDGDGALSLLELETFWEHQQNRLPDQYRVEDFFSLILDLIRPTSDRPYLTLMDMKKSRRAAGLFLDMLLDSRRHAENIRRATDGAFRLRDEVWGEVESEGAALAAEGSAGGAAGGVVGIEEWEGGVRRLRLEGWDKFSERCYRDLTAPPPTQGGAMSSPDGSQEGSPGSQEEQVVGGMMNAEAGGAIEAGNGPTSPECGAEGEEGVWEQRESDGTMAELFPRWAFYTMIV
ncbi:hypothetical protein HK101_003414 [Irineochytrium annulatum]|nr:hypothetical protein HK101_003414 [Irineochytrium annulatum]